jgi:hypothetical protein
MRLTGVQPRGLLPNEQASARPTDFMAADVFWSFVESGTQWMWLGRGWMKQTRFTESVNPVATPQLFILVIIQQHFSVWKVIIRLPRVLLDLIMDYQAETCC